MTPQRWQQVKQLLAQVIELPAPQRAAHLDRVSGSDAELRQEVLSLLAASENAQGFLETPAAGQPTHPPNGSWVGQRIGPYQIVAEIGRGGMGEVYKAQRADEQFQQQVAIKLVRRDYAIGQVVDRFKSERQILANLDHPNIARLLDGGLTATGLPYFVMELIEGEPVDTYCNSRNLSIAERLRLFATVCGAVHYAHQRLVVHRDIKPSNILVTREGVPKLLDFGVAKILADQPLQTTNKTTQLQPLTPEYASPEQVRGEDVTTTSDVYSLGVLLYEFLTGRSPYSGESTLPHEIAKQICESQPPRPSTANRRAKGESRPGIDDRSARRELRGDLDNIVLMALRKEPQRRYASAEQFAEDIRRHLNALPVIARADTWGYRTGKFLRRNAVGVAAAAAVLLSLAGGMLAAQREARIANEQRARAERHFNEVRKLANSLMFEVHDAIKDLPGSTSARQLLVKNALTYLDSLSRELSNDVSLQRELAAAYEKLGDVQGGFRAGSLGDSQAALNSYEKALAIRERLTTKTTAIELLRELGANHGKIGDVLVRQGEPLEAVKHSRTFLSIAERIQTLRPNDLDSRFTLANAHGDLGLNLAEAQQWEESLSHGRKCVALFEELSAARPSDPRQLRILARAYRALAQALTNSATDYREAISLYEKSLAAIATRLAAEPNNTDLRSIAAAAHVGIGVAHARLGNKERAKQEFAGGISEYESLSSADPKSVRHRFNAASAMSELGGLLAQHDEPEQALAHLERALSLLIDLPATALADVRTRIVIALTQARLSKLHAQLTTSGKPQHSPLASELYQKAVPVLQDAQARGLLMPYDSAWVASLLAQPPPSK